MDEDEHFRGTGPRLVSITEAAEILGVSEAAILEWIDTGRFRAVTLPNGEYRLRVADERHVGSDDEDSTYLIHSEFYKLDFLSADLTDAEHAEWEEDRGREQRERRLAGIDRGGIEVGRLADRLATRLFAALPMHWTASATDGLITVADPDGIAASEIELALILGDAETGAADRVLGAAVIALDLVQTDLAEATSEPWPDRMTKSYPGLAPSDGEIVDHELRLWYGSAEDPVVTLEPINLIDLLRDSS